MERTPLIEGKKFDIFIHGPFATGVYLDAGKLSSIDDDFLRELVRESKYQIIHYSKESIPYMERIIHCIKLVLCDDGGVSKSITYKFENNIIYLYECGTGVFSTQVTVTFQGDDKGDSMASVQKAEEFARDIVPKKFEEVLLNISGIFSNTVKKQDNKQDNKQGIRHLTWIESDYFVKGHLAWLHSVYYLAKENTPTDLSFLPDQIPHEISSSMGRYVFITDFGIGRSIFMTKETFSEENVIRLRRLLEAYQYFYYGLYQLDTLLLKKMYKGNIDFNHQKNPSETITVRLNNLNKMIGELDNLKSSVIRYLEQFRYGSTFLVGPAGQRSLVEELEKQWDMDRMEEGIRNKLDLFGRELSSKEQALLAKQQERLTKQERILNTLFLYVTLISIAGLTAQLLVLAPVADTFRQKSNILYNMDLWIVLLFSAIIIGIVFYTYHRMKEK
jgi:hypothetical protein